MAADGYYIYYGRDDEEIPPEVTRVRIDKSLAVIPTRAFYENPNIEEVDCDNVETIEEWAFHYCPSLRLVIMRGVKVVGWRAFMNCVALTDVECDQLEIIGREAFGGCESLMSINLPSAKIVEYGAFYKCTALANVKFCKELETMGVNAFIDCTSLERITIPLKDGIITADYIFHGCEKLKHVDLVEGAVLYETTDALLLEEWKNDMNREIGAINQGLLNAPAGFNNAGEKARAIQKWIRSVLGKIIYYKAKHYSYLNEAAATLQSHLPNDIVLENVLPFLQLPSYTFEEVEQEDGEQFFVRLQIRSTHSNHSHTIEPYHT
eukprot:scaffold37787_cov153-Skeletonema_marinoi.AAC.10